MNLLTSQAISKQTSCKTTIWLFLIPIVSMMFSSCFSFSNMQSGRSLGKEKVELNMSAGYLGITDGDLSGTIAIPVFEFGGRYGVSENMDIGLKLSNFGTAIGSLKYQFSGTKESQFAAATGFGIGTSLFRFDLDGEGISFFQYEIPLHLSYHPTEKLGLIFTPRYMGIGGSAAGDAGLSHMLAFSPGIEFGNRFKFAIEYNMIIPVTELALSDGFFSQLGLGFRYAF